MQSLDTNAQPPQYNEMDEYKIKIQNLKKEIENIDLMFKQKKEEARILKNYLKNIFLWKHHIRLILVKMVGITGRFIIN